MEDQREHFASRLGFIFMTAGCAIGLGNVWRFPYIAGAYGGGLFVLLYFVCLLLFGLPLLLMELSLGRAGQKTFPGAFAKLQNPDSRFKWQIPAYILFSGNMILLMFYTAVTGWLLEYMVKFVSNSPEIWQKEYFGNMLADPGSQIIYMLIALAVTVAVCLGGVRKMIEKSIKVMMGGLFVLMGILIIQSLRQPGAATGLKFFLCPDITNFAQKGFLETLHAAMSQAFFTLSIGIGSIAVCGSYINKERSLFQESIWIIILDTTVAIASGLIIFPSCMAFDIQPDSGPSLIFVTLPKVFENMHAGWLWGTLFFLFLAVAAISTLIAVFENLVAFGMDEFKWSRRFSCMIFGIALAFLSLPCILGFNLWSHIRIAGGNILDLEDFIVSANLLPLGGLYLTFFCMNKTGWGKENFFAEANTGKGWKFPLWMSSYIRFVCPVIIFLLWVIGWLDKFGIK